MQSNKINPFFALEVTRDGLNDQFDNRKKAVKPVLSAEKVSDMEYKISESISYGIDIEMHVYESGYVNTVRGAIAKIDSISREVVLINKSRIKFSKIVDIKYI